MSAPHATASSGTSSTAPSSRQASAGYDGVADPQAAPRERHARWSFVFDRWAPITTPVEEFVLA